MAKTKAHEFEVAIEDPETNLTVYVRTDRGISQVVLHRVPTEAFKELMKQFPEIRMVGFNGTTKRTRWVRFLAEVTLYEEH